MNVASEIQGSNKTTSENLIAHYARKIDVTEAYVFGTPIRALCGKMWIPSRDGSKYPICPLCREAYSHIPD